MGLWHGANWTFVVWGVYHAVLIAMYRLSKRIREKLPSMLATYGGWIITLPMAMLGWIPFRARSLGDAVSMFGKIVSPADYLSRVIQDDRHASIKMTRDHAACRSCR